MLRTSFERGRAEALSRFGVKVAIAMPAAAPGLLSRIAGPAKKALGLGALGAAGAAAYGLHKGNVEDREKGSLVYAPTSGGFAG